jgi:exopolysaccharide production protein ExoQ
MSPLISALVFFFAILTLFKLDAEPKSRTSPALWLSVAWLLINGSRPLTAWFESSSLVLSAQNLEEGNPLDRNVYLVILIAAVIVLIGRRARVAKILRANRAIPLFLFYCAVSIAWSDYSFVSFKRWIKLVGDFAMVLIVLTDPDRSSAIKRVLTRVAFILIPVSVLLIKYYPELAIYYDPWTGRRMVSGVAVDKNMLGMTCLVFGLGVFFQVFSLYLDKKNRVRTRRLIAQGIVLAMVFWLFNQADSMTSFSCFIMGSVVVAAMSVFKMTRKPGMVHLLVGGLIGASFSTLFLHIGSGALETMGRNPTLTGRTEIWAGLLQFSGNPLIGTGFDSFWLGTRLQRIWAAGGQLYGINESHNGYLETYLNLGWIGVALLAVFIVAGYRDIIRSLRQDPDTRIRLAFFVVAVIYNFTEAAFRATCSIWFVFVLATTAVPSLLVRNSSGTLDLAPVKRTDQGDLIQGRFASREGELAVTKETARLPGATIWPLDRFREE